jgi:hypothetical protein
VLEFRELCRRVSQVPFISPESTYRFEYKRAPKSCEGDPAPGLELPIDPGAGPNGVLPPPEPEPDRSLGELRPVEVPDMGWVVGM